jgi:hypothetical protein
MLDHAADYSPVRLRSYVERHFSHAAVGGELDKIYRSLAGRSEVA